MPGGVLAQNGCDHYSVDSLGDVGVLHVYVEGYGRSPSGLQNDALFVLLKAGMFQTDASRLVVGANVGDVIVPSCKFYSEEHDGPKMVCDAPVLDRKMAVSLTYRRNLLIGNEEALRADALSVVAQLEDKRVICDR